MASFLHSFVCHLFPLFLAVFLDDTYIHCHVASRSKSFSLKYSNNFSNYVKLFCCFRIREKKESVTVLLWDQRLWKIYVVRAPGIPFCREKNLCSFHNMGHGELLLFFYLFYFSLNLLNMMRMLLPALHSFFQWRQNRACFAHG